MAEMTPSFLPSAERPRIFGARPLILEPRAHEMQQSIDSLIDAQGKVPPEVFLLPTLVSIAISLKRLADANVPQSEEHSE